MQSLPDGTSYPAIVSMKIPASQIEVRTDEQQLPEARAVGGPEDEVDPTNSQSRVQLVAPLTAAALIAQQVGSAYGVTSAS